MTLTAGIAYTPVQRFPKVSADDLLPAESPLLNDEVIYDNKFFVSITLGYALERRSANKP